jgi:hypothetical protein
MLIAYLCRILQIVIERAQERRKGRCLECERYIRVLDARILSWRLFLVHGQMTFLSRGLDLGQPPDFQLPTCYPPHHHHPLDIVKPRQSIAYAKY